LPDFPDTPRPLGLFNFANGILVNAARVGACTGVDRFVARSTKT